MINVKSIKGLVLAAKLTGMVLALMATDFFFVYPSEARITRIERIDDCQRAVELYNQGTLAKDYNVKKMAFEKASHLCDDQEVLARVYNNLADVYEQKGELSKALFHYRQSIKIKQDLVTPYTSVGNILFKLGDYYSAFIMYGKALKLKPEDEDSQKGRDKAETAYKKKMIIYFDRGSATITEEYSYRLQIIGESLKNLPESTKIQVIGHTCDLGSRAFNQRLSKNRAEAVANYLKANCPINEDSLTVTGRGKKTPLLPGKNDTSRTLNRRVEILVK